MKKKILAASVSALSMFLAGTSQAADEVQFNFSGFGTLAATHSNSREADFLGSIVQPSGAGRSDAVEFGIDSKLGLQGSVNFGNGLSGILQVITDRRFDDAYRPEIEWANLKYDINKDWYARVGRVVAPVFMVSDYRNVGYSQTAVRQPTDVYSLNPITRLDGFDVGTKFELGDGTLSGQVVAGRAKLYVPNVKVSGPVAMGNLIYELNESTYRISYGKYNLELMGIDATGRNFNAYDTMVKTAGPLLGYTNANLRLHDVNATNLALGYVYDSGKWLAQAEYVERKGDGVAIQDGNAWYVLGGYRIGKWTPFASYSRLKSKEPPMSAAAATTPACIAAFGGGVAGATTCGTFAGTINAIDAGTNTHAEQSTIAFGVRYDFYKNVAFKAQYEHVRKPASPAPNAGTFDNSTATWQANSRSVNLLTVALDFVF